MIVHVINRLVPGGAEKQLQEIVGRSTLEQEIVELQETAGGTRAAVLVRLARRLRRSEPDAVVAWLERPQLTVAAVAPPRYPLIAAVGGLPRRESRRDRAAIRGAFARYSRFVTNSEAARDATREYVHPLLLRPFDVIPNGVGVTPDLAPVGGGTRPRVAFIGRNDPAKGLDVFLSALSHFRPDELDVVLVGEGVPEAVAQMPPTTRRLRVFPRVSEPWETIGTIDLLVLPSRSEGSPNVVIEAFARRVPVVGTGAGGAAELLADNRGLMVPIEDPIALAKAIRRAIDDPAASAERAGRALTYALGTHSWDRVVSAWDALLQSYMRR